MLAGRHASAHESFQIELVTTYEFKFIIAFQREEGGERERNIDWCFPYAFIVDSYMCSAGD